MTSLFAPSFTLLLRLTVMDSKAPRTRDRARLRALIASSPCLGSASSLNSKSYTSSVCWARKRSERRVRMHPIQGLDN